MLLLKNKFKEKKYRQQKIYMIKKINKNNKNITGRVNKNNSACYSQLYET